MELPVADSGRAQAHQGTAPLALTRLGEGYLLANRLEPALATAERAVQLTRKSGTRGLEAHSFRLLGEIAAHLDPPEVERAEASYTEGKRLAEEIDMRPLVAQCDLGLGALHRRLGRLDEARAELSRARELFHEMDMTWWRERAEAELAAIRGRGDPRRHDGSQARRLPLA